MSTNPIAWLAIEDVLGSWILQSGGYAAGEVRLPTPRGEGESRGPAPKAQISLLSVVQLSKQGSELMPQTQQDRYTVTAVGPGEVGVDFYEGHTLDPQRISVTAGAGDPTATSAAALLLELQAELPMGYTAAIDPLDSSSILVTGSTSEPIFAGAPADAGLLAVTTPIPRWPTLLVMQVRLVFRVSFRSADVSGEAQAANAMMRAILLRKTIADPAMNALGFESAGTLQSQPAITGDRAESTGILDIAYRGNMTGALAATAMRAARVTTTLLTG